MGHLTDSQLHLQASLPRTEQRRSSFPYEYIPSSRVPLAVEQVQNALLPLNATSLAESQMQLQALAESQMQLQAPLSRADQFCSLLNSPYC